MFIIIALDCLALHRHPLGAEILKVPVPPLPEKNCPEGRIEKRHSTGLPGK
jgi:hypothetical protein